MFTRFTVGNPSCDSHYSLGAWPSFNSPPGSRPDSSVPLPSMSDWMMAFMVAHLVCRGLARARTLGAPRYKRKPPKSSLLVNVAYLLSFVPHVADASGAIPPPSNTTVGGGGAFVNFSATTAAASFTGADNRLTFIGCAGFIDQRQSDRACVPLLGHTRGQCYAFPVYGNATSVPVCRCIAYAGLTPPGNCVDATCVWGADACSVRQWQNYVVIFLDTFALLLTAYVFGFGLYVTIVGRKNLKMNSMTVTLLSMTLASLFHLLWRVCAFLGYAVLLSAVPSAEVQQPIAIPGFTCAVWLACWRFLCSGSRWRRRRHRSKRRAVVRVKCRTLPSPSLPS